MSTPFVAILQMSCGIPVAAVAIGKAGAKRGVFCCTDARVERCKLAARIKNERDANCADVLAKDKALQDKLRRG